MTMQTTNQKRQSEVAPTEPISRKRNIPDGKRHDHLSRAHVLQQVASAQLSDQSEEKVKDNRPEKKTNPYVGDSHAHLGHQRVFQWFGSKGLL